MSYETLLSSQYAELRPSLLSLWTLKDCANYLSRCCNKIPDKSNWRKEGFILAQVPGHSASWQEVMARLRAAGHGDSTVRKQREKDAGGRLSFSLCS